MKYVARQPREGINVSDTHPLAEAGILVVALTLLFAAAAVALVFLVEIVLLFVSPELEAELFESFSPQDLVHVESDDDRLLESRALLERLSGHLDNSRYQYRLEITASELPNAMAFPGGLIVVTTALLDSAESENELAFVLGHELGHFQHRDHLRMLGRGVVMGIFFSAVAGGDGGAPLGVTIADLAQRGFNRDQESEADETGLSLVQAEYGHVADSWRFFERLEENGFGQPAILSYLSTHPSPDTRIDDIKKLARAKGWSMNGPTVLLDWRRTL